MTKLSNANSSRLNPSSSSSNGKLPLLWRTPAQWATQALSDPIALLSDHAYLERKAVTCALNLFNRWPEPDESAAESWVTHLSSIVKDEALHLDAVLRMLKKKGGVLQRSHKNQYANDLRALIRNDHDGQHTLLDSMLVSALIEARSCERFSLLAQECSDPELAKFYGGLEASESGHYTIYFTLAQRILPAVDIQLRWMEMLHAEAQIIQTQMPGCRILSGFV